MPMITYPCILATGLAIELLAKVRCDIASSDLEYYYKSLILVIELAFELLVGVNI